MKEEEEKASGKRGMGAESRKKSSKCRYENAGLSRLGEENIIFHLL